MNKVTVVGAGYVGLIQSVCLAQVGCDVTCLDVDRTKVDRLSSGEPTIHEPGLAEALREALKSGRLRFALVGADVSSVLGDVVFVAVGTPMAGNGAADLSHVRAVTDLVASEAVRPFTYVMKSTVPPGTGATLCARMQARSRVPFGYVSNPEFLREGHAIDDWYHTDRIVIGGDDAVHIGRIKELYGSLDAPVLETDVASAETIKYASNAFLSTKISFINEIANVCDCVGADVDSVALGIGMDKRIGSDFLRAGIGYGGSCFPKDTRALDFISTLSGYQFNLLRTVIEVNSRQRLLPVIRLMQALKELSRHKIAVLGLSFKPFTDDVRESPALDVVPLLVEEGAEVTLYDPVAVDVDLAGARRCDDVFEALEGASAALLLTEWPEFVDLDWSRARTVMCDPAIVFDGRNALDRDAVQAAGLVYMAVGREGAHRLHRHL